MLSRNGRIVVIIASLVAGVLSWRSGSPTWWLFPLAALAFAVAYWRNGPIWLVSRALRRGDLTRADRLLREVRRPELLSPQQRTYYQYYRGLLCLHRGEREEARQCLRQASAGRLRTENDRSIVQLQLAALAMESGDTASAREHLARARALSHKSEVAMAIADLDARLSAV